jgi:hypothetical protein
MTTSGSYDYSNTATEIIQRAMRICGVLGTGETPSGDDYQVCKIALNQMIKNWQVKNVGLWLKKLIYVFTADGTQSYLIGPSGTNATFSMVATAIASDATSGAGTITVDSDDGISSGDFIGIELDDGTMQWTTVNGAPAADVITLTAVLTDDAATDNVVYTYTTKSKRPLKINQGLLNVGGDEFELRQASRAEYFRLAQKSTEGQITQFYYDPLTTNGKLYVWPTTDDVSSYIILDALIPVQDFDSADDDPDFPQEWLEPLSICLADKITFEFDVPTEKAQRIKADAIISFNDTWSHDMENVSTQFVPGR